MSSNNAFQQEVMTLLARLKAKKEQLQKEYQDKLSEVDREIESVSTTVRLLRQPPDSLAKVHQQCTVKDNALISQLIGKTARKALAMIAISNGGYVRIVDAKPMLIEAGIIKKPKHAWGAIYTNLTRSPEFEKVQGETGTFKLSENPSQPKLSVAS